MSDARKMLCNAKDAAWDMDSDGGADDDLVADSSQMGDCEPSVALAAVAWRGATQRRNADREPRPRRQRQAEVHLGGGEEHEHEHHGHEGIVYIQVRHLPASASLG